jgi:rRNA processing protein Gar1
MKKSELRQLIREEIQRLTEVYTNFEVDDVVYNTRTKHIGIVRDVFDRGDVRTDADGVVHTSELEIYNTLKYKHQSDAKIAPSTKKEIEKRKLVNPFSKKYNK